MERLNDFLRGLDEAFGRSWCTVLFTNAFAIAFIFVLIWVGKKIGVDFHARLVNYLLIVIGSLVGWAIAMFSAPYGSKDKDALAQLGKLASVFISGYVVSKLDRFVEASTFSNNDPVSENWIRIGLFGAAALLSLITVVTNRVYFRPDPSDDKKQADLVEEKSRKVKDSPAEGQVGAAGTSS
ncbi:hypothetical protein [Paraburkholderia terrae]|uniref:hypothetical protein n=1 Tax=Paraburkholderia terrae TaxID=311230 RepID=UPI002052F941|nr:hypothetical protein [Paraburkholderia terrae]BDC46034.1 hypothetical protein PTKU15_93310 [Paraburkholderia terrae]